MEKKIGSQIEYLVDEWNGLISQVVSAQSIESFTRRLDKYMDGDDRWK